MNKENPLIVLKEPIKVSSKNVRDAIIAKLETLVPNAPFTKPFTTHLKLMGKNKLDKYNEMEFVLEEFGATVKVSTTLMGGEQMVYTFPKNPGLPPDDLMRTKFLGLF
jgi:hypothetical protein